MGTARFVPSVRGLDSCRGTVERLQCYGGAPAERRTKTRAARAEECGSPARGHVPAVAGPGKSRGGPFRTENSAIFHAAPKDGARRTTRAPSTPPHNLL